MEIETLSNLRIKVDNTSISTKLRSGYGSCPSESSEISQILQLAEKDLEDYETALHELHMRTLSVQFHKSRLEGYMERLRSMRAPIRRLPNELLLRIFTFCCGGNDGGHSRFGIPNVIVISAVCTRWRELVDSYSQLWTRFAVRFCSNEDYDPEQDIATSQIKLYLERSRDKLVSMCISAGYWGEPSGHPGFQLLLAQSHRWRNLFFEGEFSSRSHPGLLFARLSL
ncbi:hypothetical protein BT96DRAFT_336839 [Gymnopus androsaceus JB14]|uniref:F-box domain-containing protein n=1 Tax=Gymnopus androsaceus JB14 TaxID=1447944 RepID=A0A6A4I644_9AGAR|nr:hypothetical protein BT96DRAFT_336839 [Gymnopus androsaceus JB14]